MTETQKAGQILARGVQRHLHQLNIASIVEFVPTRGLRVDVIGLTAKGEIWIVECKSSIADFQSDSKWQNYLEWCDRYFFAVPADFPTEILPADTGLILADGYGAEMITEAPLDGLSAARRKKITLKFSRNAAQRLAGFTDPRI